MHNVAPEYAEKPAKHCLHTLLVVAEVRVAYVPDIHDSQVFAPDEDEYDPAGHVMHVLAPSLA